MRNFLLGALSGVFLFILGAILYLRLGLAEMRGDLAPSSFENGLMTAAVHASVRRHAPETPNPVLPTDDNLTAGGKLFINDCSGCHGDPNRSEDNSDTLSRGSRNFTRWVRNTPRRRSSGSPNMEFGAAVCSQMENGIQTRISGRWPLTSSASEICLPLSKKHWSQKRPARQTNSALEHEHRAVTAERTNQQDAFAIRCLT